MELEQTTGAAPPVGRPEPNPLPSLPDGISGVWALHSEGGQPLPSRYALADSCAYLLFAFDAMRAGRRDLVYARLIGPRARPFLIDQRPRLCVGVRVVAGFVQAAFGLPASELVDQRVDYGMVYSNVDADLDSIRAARTDDARVAGALALPLDLEVYEGASWSPTGDRLAFVGKRGGDIGLWTVRSDGSDLTFRLYTIAQRPAWGR